MGIEDKLSEDRLNIKDKKYILNELERERRKEIIRELYYITFKGYNFESNQLSNYGILKSLGALSLVNQEDFLDIIKFIYDYKHIIKIHPDELGTWGALAIINKYLFFKACKNNSYTYISDNISSESKLFKKSEVSKDGIRFIVHSKLYSDEIYSNILKIEKEEDLIKYYETEIKSSLITESKIERYFDHIKKNIDEGYSISGLVDFLEILFKRIEKTKDKKYSQLYAFTLFHKIITSDFDLFASLHRERIEQRNSKRNYTIYDEVLNESLSICVLDALTTKNIIPEDKTHELFYSYLDSHLILDKEKQQKPILEIIKELSKIIHKWDESYYEKINEIIKKKEIKTFDELLECSDIESAYQIVSKLGQGASGTTYKVYSTELKQYFALKIINYKFNPREAELMAKLKGEDLENIVQIHDAGKHIVKVNGEEKYAIVMEYVDGNSLRESIELTRKAKMNLKLIIESIEEKNIKKSDIIIKNSDFFIGGIHLEILLNYATELLNGIVSLRKYDITHRDLNPNNIKVTENKNIKILDFGIATDEESPKQIDARRYGHPSFRNADDLFSLGLIIYEMFTGEHLIEKKNEYIGITTHAKAIQVLKETMFNNGKLVEIYEQRIPLEIKSIVLSCLYGEEVTEIKRQFTKLRPYLNEYFMNKAELITINGQLRERIVELEQKKDNEV